MERNLKYAQLRREQALPKKKNGDVDMNEEGDGKKEAKENVYRKALWELVEESKINGVPLAAASGEGTTLGGPAF